MLDVGHQVAETDKYQRNFYSNNKEQDQTVLDSPLEERKSWNPILSREELCRHSLQFQNLLLLKNLQCESCLQ